MKVQAKVNMIRIPNPIPMIFHPIQNILPVVVILILTLHLHIVGPHPNKSQQFRIPILIYIYHLPYK